MFNNDDDDLNGQADCEQQGTETTVDAEDDLSEFWIGYSPDIEYLIAKGVNVSASCSANIALWSKPDKSLAFPPPAGHPDRFALLSTVYVEGLSVSQAEKDAWFEITLASTGGTQAKCKVELTVYQFEFCIPDSYDQNTGLPTAGAQPKATDMIGASHPMPTVNLGTLSTANVTIDSDTATLRLTGTVRDPIADNVDFGKVSADGADIDELYVYVDGATEAAHTITLNRQSDGASSFWRQYPYKAPFDNISISVPLTEGTHVVHLETSENAAGNVGFVDVGVTLEKRLIAGGTGIGGTAIMASICFDAEPTAGLVDSIRYYYGDREPAPDDAALTESPEPDSLAFSGEFSGVEATVTITQVQIEDPENPGSYIWAEPSAFEGFHQGYQDKFRADIVYTSVDGGTMTFSSEFTKATPDGLRFIGSFSSLANPGTGELGGGEFAYTSHDRLVFSGDLNPDALDTIRFYTGTTEPADGGITLTETGEDTKEFNSTPDNPAISMNIVEFDGLTTGTDHLIATTSFRFPDGSVSSTEQTFEETGSGTSTFDHTDFPPDGGAYSWSVVSVEKLDQSWPGRYVPAAIRLKGPGGVEAKKIRLWNRDFDVVASSGFFYPAINNKIVVGPTVYSGWGYTFFFPDTTQSKLGTGEFDEKMGAEFVKSGSVEVSKRFMASRLELRGKYGLESIRRVPIFTLLDKIEDENVDVEDECLGKIRVYGYKKKQRIEVSSPDTGESFELLLPDAQPQLTRSAVMSEKEGYAESEQEVCVYHSYEDQETVSDAQWNLLRDMDILAIHNPDPLEEIRDLSTSARIPGYQDHHLFPQSREFMPFWDEIFGKDIDIHDFTVPADAPPHNQKWYAWNNSWRAFIAQQRELMARGKGKQAVLRDTMNNMLKMAGEKEFNYNVSLVRRYTGSLRTGSKPAAYGSSLDKLFEVAHKYGKIDLKKDERWRKLACRAGKQFGKRFLRALPWVGRALVAWAIVTKINDPVGALAEAMDVSRETAQEIVGGQLTMGIPFWMSGQSVDSAELQDGLVITVGEPVLVYKPVYIKGPDGLPISIGEARWAKRMKVREIYTSDTEGEVNIIVDDGTAKGITFTGFSHFSSPPRVVQGE